LYVNGYLHVLHVFSRVQKPDKAGHLHHEA